MRIVVLLTTFLLLIICGYSIYEWKCRSVSPVERTAKWYRKEVDQLDSKAAILHNAIERNQPLAKIQDAFLKTRLAYKRIETIIEYYHPYTAQAMNGVVDDDQQEKILQELEGLLFPTLQPADTQKALIAATRLAAIANRIHLSGQSLIATDAQLFDAMRLELVRIMALSLSGFDSHAAGNSLPEAAAALDGVKDIWRFYAPGVKVYNPSLEKYTNQLLAAAQASLKRPADFDRQQFVTDYVNHLSVNLKLSREALHIPYDGQVFIIDPAASYVFAKDAINPAYYLQNSLNFSGNDPVYEVNGQLLRASYMNGLLRQNSTFSTMVSADPE